MLATLKRLLSAADPYLGCLSNDEIDALEQP
jgi:hypothetical protein